ncbi:MAG: hypothetical protein L0Y67_01440 [Gammaproteobacteria bacterium]|nr:hypothetical protein [Gammaproteobacteria bacterium]MCI0590266.1 hypothetical protein [Gammaproteobacteria bacterium]
MGVLWLSLAFLVILGITWVVIWLRENKKARQLQKLMTRNALSMLNIVLVSAREPDTGALAKEKQNDEYLVGYMAGIASACATFTSRLTRSRVRSDDQLHYLHRILRTYFPGAAEAIMHAFVQKACDPDSTFSHARNRAEADMTDYWEALNKGIKTEEEPNAALLCPGLIAHLGRSAMAVIPTVDGKIVFKGIFEQYVETDA